MLRRIFSCLVGVSAALAMLSSASAAPLTNLPPGSSVFIASMPGLGSYFRAATKAIDVPLVFVATEAEADFVVSGTTKEMPRDRKLDADDAASGVRTTRVDTTIQIANIKSGELVFKHSVRTLVQTPADETGHPHRATGDRTSASLLANGKETAARRCVLALQDAMKEKP
jgi:hypothetical protein